MTKSNIKASKIKLASVYSINVVLPLNLSYNYEKLFEYNISEEVYKKYQPRFVK